MTAILWAIVVLLFFAWLFGVVVNAGWWINILLVLSIVAFIVNLVTTAMQGTKGY